MRSKLRASTKSATLLFTVAVSWACPLAHAQMTGGPGLSSGSGAGTGAGGFTGVIRNRAGSVSGVGPQASGNILRGQPVTPLPGASSRRPIASFGPGVDVSFPNDPYLIPFMAMEDPSGARDNKLPNRITTELVKNARLIATPEERSLALQRIAKGAIETNQLTLAHQTLEEAITATSQVTVPLVRDQRLIAIVTSLNLLSEALLREGNQYLTAPIADDPNAKPEPLPKSRDTQVLIRTARLEWQRSVYLASIIDNPTYRNEMLYKVAESEASGSATIANEYMRTLESDLPPDGRPSPGDQPVPPKPAPADKPAPKNAKPDRNEVYQKLADSVLIDSFDVAKKIDRLIWKYRAMVRIALLAADSRQFARGVELARGIENGESRAEAMLLLAESQCRPGSGPGQVEAAKVTYQAAAEAVACVHQDGLRGVLTGFLVDSLISTGRFDDARACIVIYPSLSEKLVALGAIAEQQGRRGGAESARRWIASEVPEEYRPALYRHVTSGVLWTIEQNRSKEIPGEPIVPAAP